MSSLRCNFDPVYVDIDSVFLRNPWELFENDGKSDIEFSQEQPVTAFAGNNYIPANFNGVYFQFIQRTL
jgi:hypothetical protein